MFRNSELCQHWLIQVGTGSTESSWTAYRGRWDRLPNMDLTSGTPWEKSERNAVSKHTFHQSYETIHCSFNGHMWVLKWIQISDIKWLTLQANTLGNVLEVKSVKNQIHMTLFWSVFLYFSLVKWDLYDIDAVQCERNRLHECCDTQGVCLMQKT